MKNTQFNHTDNHREYREQELPDNLIIGRNAVNEAIKSGRTIDKIMISRGERSGSIGKIIAQCREKGIVVKEVDPKKLDFLCGGGNHQGVVASCAAHTYATVEDIIAYAESKNEPPFILILDEIEDAHNLGAIVRTAEASGVHGIILPKRRSASLNYIVAKTACGALEYVKVARVANLPCVIDDLKKRNIWIYGADMDGGDFAATDYSGPVGLVIGSEGSGMGRLVREKCDFIVSIPMQGKINSLNASVAAGVLMYEVVKQRLTK